MRASAPYYRRFAAAKNVQGESSLDIEWTSGKGGAGAVGGVRARGQGKRYGMEARRAETRAAPYAARQPDRAERGNAIAVTLRG